MSIAGSYNLITHMHELISLGHFTLAKTTPRVIQPPKRRLEVGRVGELNVVLVGLKPMPAVP